MKIHTKLSEHKTILIDFDVFLLATCFLYTFIHAQGDCSDLRTLSRWSRAGGENLLVAVRST